MANTLESVKNSSQLIFRLKDGKLVLSPSLLSTQAPFSLQLILDLRLSFNLSSSSITSLVMIGKPAPHASINSLPPSLAIIEAIRGRAQSSQASRWN